jgi:hypothetical protein
MIPEPVSVFLTFDDEDNRRFEHLTQAVKNLSAALLADPSTCAIRPSLAKAFRLRAHDLVKQLAIFIALVVLGNNPTCRRRLLFGPEVASLQRLNHSKLVTAGMTVDQHYPVRIAEAKRRIPVVVRRTACDEAAA